MNVLEFKNGDRVTLTALYDDDGGGNPLTKLLIDDDDTNIYADVSARELESETLFIQYNSLLSGAFGIPIYQYISCQLDEDSHRAAFTIRDFKIESKRYPLSSGWGGSKGLYLVESFKNNIPFVNWSHVPWSVK